MIKSQDITAAILAGGQSRRMGQPKALLSYPGKNVSNNDEQSFLAHLVEALQPQVSQVVVAGLPAGVDYRRVTDQVITDPEDLQGEGPLAGLLAALRWANTPYLLSVPCDNPELCPALIDTLVAAMEQHHVDAVYVYDGDRQQPLYGLLKTTLAPSLASYLASGQRRVMVWYDQVGAVAVDFSANANYFRNVNTPADYAQLLEANKPS